MSLNARSFLEGKMKKIALYGYGNYGKKAAESFRRFWDNEYSVTAIFDQALYGQTDSYWNTQILAPEQVYEEYKRGTFESVMVCIYDRDTHIGLCNWLENMGIPVFYSGKEEDFAEPELFLQDNDPKISVSEDRYSFHVYKNMLGAVADYNWRMMFLFNEEGKVYIENHKKYMPYFKPYMLSYPFRLKDPIPEKVFMKGEYCLMAKMYSTNYWHFTVEIADGIYLMEAAGYKGKYIYNENGFSKVLMSLMGVTSDRLISIRDLDYHKVYVFERLYDINHDGMDEFECSETVLPKMADKIKKTLKKDDSYPKKLYIKRIGQRKLLNGEDIAVQNGFQVIVPEEYSVIEQMNLFHNADIVISPHGANSTNYLYMHQGAVFAEIFSDIWYAHFKDSNLKICEACGIHYLLLTGKPCSCSNNKSEGMKADYTVDKDALLQLIRTAEEIQGKTVG